VVRKIQGGNRTPEGAHDHEIIALRQISDSFSYQ